MNTSREDRGDPMHRMRYPTVETLGASTPQRDRHAAAPRFLLPTREADANEKAASREFAELQAKLANLERQLALTAERSRLEGEAAGRSQAGEEFRRALMECRGAVTAALEAFAAERQSYFRKVEREVVQLALAIAKKILHREAQMDALLLSGAVHAALDRLEETTTAVLRVPPPDGEGWRNAFTGMSENRRPKLIEDATLRSGDCVLECGMGTIDLSVGAQLDEIGRGFFDLLREMPVRPKSAEGAAADGARRARGAGS